MIVFPNCKINLGLRILRKRDDGFHELETIFYPIPVYDVLEILPLENQKKGVVQFQQSGFFIEGTEDQNLCVRAYRLLQETKQDIASVSIHLHKNIPMGAGLGGGSADGVFTLLALQSLFKLAISNTDNQKMALQLGSDCPFFLQQKPVIGLGRGEKLSPISLSLSGYHILLIHPGISISTAAAFQGVKPTTAGESLAHSILEPVEKWKDFIYNQFEETIFLRYPSLKTIKENLYNWGALYASMSGSGSTVFGIFPPDASKPAYEAYPWVQWRKFP